MTFFLDHGGQYLEHKTCGMSVAEFSMNTSIEIAAHTPLIILLAISSDSL